MQEQVILVDEQDRQVGVIEKMEAHRQALLHRAFSIFIFNKKGEMLLQRRAAGKYHSPGLWTNACCSHPRPGEDVLAAATRRLQEELGFSTPLNEIFHFTYKTSFENGLTEYEFDHVLIGRYDEAIHPNPDEVSDYAFRSLAVIRADLQSWRENFTYWFQVVFPKIEGWMSSNDFAQM